MTERGDERNLVESHALATRVESLSHPRVEMASDAVIREFREHSRMPDYQMLGEARGTIGWEEEGQK